MKEGHNDNTSHHTDHALDRRVSAGRPARRNSPRPRFWPATEAARWRRTATTCAASSNGRLTVTSRCSTPPESISSCTEQQWNNAGSRHRRSTDASRRCAATTASLTSTAASRPTPPSTSGVRRCNHAEGRGMDRAELARFLFTAEHYDHAHAALGRVAGSQRLAGLRSLCHRHRRPRFRARSPHAADRRQGQQARHHPTRPAHRSHDRPRHR